MSRRAAAMAIKRDVAEIQSERIGERAGLRSHNRPSGFATSAGRRMLPQRAGRHPPQRSGANATEVIRDVARRSITRHGSLAKVCPRR